MYAVVSVPYGRSVCQSTSWVVKGVVPLGSTRAKGGAPTLQDALVFVYPPGRLLSNFFQNSGGKGSRFQRSFYFYRFFPSRLTTTGVANFKYFTSFGCSLDTTNQTKVFLRHGAYQVGNVVLFLWYSPAGGDLFKFLGPDRSPATHANMYLPCGVGSS